MDEGRKRGLAIVAGILVAGHLKNPEDLRDSRPSPRWAERIMRKIDSLCGCRRPRPRRPSPLPRHSFLYIFILER